MQGGSLTIGGGEDIILDTAVEDQVRQETRSGNGLEVKKRRCGRCNLVGHNARTCIQRQQSTVEQ